MGLQPPWRAGPEGLLLVVRVTPKGGADAIEGVAEMADGRCVLKVRVRAAASDGGANAALIKHLAGALGVAVRDVSLLAGAHGRTKRVKIVGDGAVLAATLEGICTR